MDNKAHFGIFGGRYVIETIMPALFELEETYQEAMKDKTFLDVSGDRHRSIMLKSCPSV